MPAAGRPSLADATAAILAGGLGTRLAPVVPDRPKVLAAVAGKPFLAHVLDRLATAGVRRAVLCTGHLGQQIHRAFGDRYRELRLSYSHESEPAGTAGALRLAGPLLVSDPVLVLNGDSLCRAPLDDVWAWHHARSAAATIVLARADRPERFGRVELDPAGRVRTFTEKSEQGGGCWVNAGVYLLGQQLLADVPAGRAVSLEREVLPRWVGRGLHGYGTEESLLDIGTPDDYATAAEWLAVTEPPP